MSELREAAKYYASVGWKVFPLKPNAKTPLTAHGVKDATSDATQVEAWWTQWPDANIGFACGGEDGAHIIDVDVDTEKGIDGWKTINELLATGKTFPKTIYQNTPRGGAHFFYRAKARPLNRNSFMHGIDIRSEGYYVLLPPSIHPNGKKYQWATGLAPWEHGLAEYPDFMRPAERAPVAVPTQPIATPSVSADSSVIERARLYLATCDPAVQGQGGHDKLLWAASALVNGFLLPDDVARGLLETEFNPRCQPPWDMSNPADAKDFRRKVTEARKNPLAKPAGWLLNDLAYTPVDDIMPGLREAIAKMIARHTSATTVTTSQTPSSVNADDGPLRAQEKVNASLYWKPFPVNAIPDPVSRYVQAAGSSIGCDPAFVGLPLLAALAGAIGTSTRIELKPDWQEPAVVWTAIIGDSGTHKSPALKAATYFTDEQDSRELRVFREKEEDYKKLEKEYELDLKKWQRKPSGPPPTEPPVPVCRRFLISDVTVEALADRLADNPRGTLISRDELAGWLESFNQYKGGRGADVAAWLSIYNASSLRVDRRGGDRKTIFVPLAAVSITGGIQPPVLARSLGVSHFENGLAARLLVAMPPKRPRRWTDRRIPPDANDAMQRVFTRLWSLQAKADPTDPDGEPRPVDLPLTQDAKQTWIEFYNRHGAEITAMTGDLAAAWSKLEGYAARLALVCHLVNWAAGNDVAPGPVDQTAVASGIELVEWFKNETRRVYAVLSETDAERGQRRLVEWIGQRGGKVTVREVQQGHRQFKTKEDAQAALTALVNAGLGQWETVPPTPKGGRACCRFVLSTASTVYTTPLKPEKNRGSVDVDSVDVVHKPQSRHSDAED